MLEETLGTSFYDRMRGRLVLKDSFTSLLQTLVLQMPVTGLYEGKTFAQDFQATQKVFGSLKTLFGLFLVSEGS
ncbi:hypothetical protein P3S68_001052 [Capsicum galapagoense]